MSIPAHVVPRQAGQSQAQEYRALLAKQLLLGRYLDPWGKPDIVWCHSHSLVRGYKVILNVYNLLPPKLNGWLFALRLGGAFHSGVQVGATEYAFGGHPNDDLGITVLEKPLFVLREEAMALIQKGEDDDGAAAANMDWMPTLHSRTVVGWWMGPLSQLDTLLRELRFDELWIGSEYRLLSRNCNHFARAMCAALLRNPLFKPAPGCSRPEHMVPSSVTRLPALVLALSCCAPCIVRRLNAPLPLATHGLNAFQGHGRKARVEGTRARPAPAGRQARVGGGDGDSAGSPLSISISATAGSATTAAAIGVRQVSSSTAPGLRVGSGGGGGGLRWPSGSPPPAAFASGGSPAAPVASAAAAATEGRAMRLTGRYQSLRVETAPRPSMDRPSRSSCRRGTEDGGGGGTDTATDDHSTACSTPDLSGGGGAAIGAATYASNIVCNGQLSNCNGSQPSPPEGMPKSPFALAATSASGVHTGTSAGGPSTTAGASAAASATPSTQTTACSVSLPTPFLVLDQAYTAAAATSTANTASQRAPVGPRFMSTSRSGRRVFPDPRVATLGTEGAGSDVAQYGMTTAFTADAPASRAQPSSSPSHREPTRAELELSTATTAPPATAAAGAAAPRDTDAGLALRQRAPVTASGASQRQPPALSSRAQQPHYTPRSSGNGLPPLGAVPRLEGSPARLAAAGAAQSPLPPPPSQLQLQLQLQVQHQSTPLVRALAATADGAVAAAGGGGAMNSTSSEPPRPWSVLSGGFVDLLFSPSATTEPPPGVPNPVALGSTGTCGGGGDGGGGAGGGGGGGGGGAAGGGARRMSSLTGEGGAMLSATSNATGGGGGLETVTSGDLDDGSDGDDDDELIRAQNLHKSVARARASTGTLGLSIGGEQVAGGGGGGGAVTVNGLVAPTSGMGAAAAAAASPLRPTGAPSRAGGRMGFATAPGAAPMLMSMMPAVGAGAVADGSPTATLAGRKPH